MDKTTLIITVDGDKFDVKTEYSTQPDPKKGPTLTQVAGMVALNAIDEWFREAVKNAENEAPAQATD